MTFFRYLHLVKAKKIVYVAPERSGREEMKCWASSLIAPKGEAVRVLCFVRRGHEGQLSIVTAATAICYPCRPQPPLSAASSHPFAVLHPSSTFRLPSSSIAASLPSPSSSAASAHSAATPAILLSALRSFRPFQTTPVRLTSTWTRIHLVRTAHSPRPQTRSAAGPYETVSPVWTTKDSGQWSTNWSTVNLRSRRGPTSICVLPSPQGYSKSYFFWI